MSDVIDRLASALSDRYRLERGLGERGLTCPQFATTVGCGPRQRLQRAKEKSQARGALGLQARQDSTGLAERRSREAHSKEPGAASVP